MKRILESVICCWIFVASNTLSICADDVASPEKTAKWVEQLEADEYAIREAATANLTKAGKSVIPAVEKAVDTGKPETAYRGKTILRRLANSDDKATSAAANAAMERLGIRQNVVAAADKPAENNAQAQAGVAVVQIGGQGGAIQIQGGGIQIAQGQVLQLGGGQATFQIAVQAVAGAKGESKSVTTVNGVKTTNVTEAGKQIKILENADGSLEVEVTEKADGKSKTEKVAAKNAEALKKANPKLYALYKKHAAK